MRLRIEALDLWRKAVMMMRDRVQMLVDGSIGRVVMCNEATV
jgi:hypothetical protein